MEAWLIIVIVFTCILAAFIGVGLIATLGAGKQKINTLQLQHAAKKAPPPAEAAPAESVRRSIAPFDSSPPGGMSGLVNAPIQKYSASNYPESAPAMPQYPIESYSELKKTI
jgi:hypothetical protein